MEQTRRPSADEIEAALLEALRSEVSPRAEYAEPPALLGDGVIARAFSLRLQGVDELAHRPLVCRLSFDDTSTLPPDQTLVEAALHRALHDQGYPVPEVFAVGGAGTSLRVPFMLMERVPGRPLFIPLAALLTLTAVLAAWVGVAPLLAVLLGYWWLMQRLLSRLHALSADSVRSELARAGLSPERLSVSHELARLDERVSALSLDALAPALEWLAAERPPEPPAPSICHGDFWMGNVMLSTRRITLLDWTQACLAAPEYDLGWMTIQHYSRAPVALPIPERVYDVITAVVRPVVWLLFGANQAIYSVRQRSNAERRRYYAVLHSVRVLTRVAELRLLGCDPRSPELVAWGSPQTVALLCGRILRTTGRRVTIPAAGLPVG